MDEWKPLQRGITLINELIDEYGLGTVQAGAYTPPLLTST